MLVVFGYTVQFDAKQEFFLLEFTSIYFPCSSFFFPFNCLNGTSVGRVSRSQLSQDQVRVYLNEESNRRRNLLQKYIRLCADAKVYLRTLIVISYHQRCHIAKSWLLNLDCTLQVTVDSMLIEHGNIAKAILDLIPVVNITKLVIGTKRVPYSRWGYCRFPENLRRDLDFRFIF